jgi:hypothetical protein
VAATPNAGSAESLIQVAPERYFDIPSLAAYALTLGFPASRNFIRAAINDGRLPAIRAGKKFVVSLTSWNDFLQRCERRRPR